MVGEAGGGYSGGAHGYDTVAENFCSKVPGDTEGQLIQADRRQRFLGGLSAESEMSGGSGG